MSEQWTDETVDWYEKSYGDDPSIFAVISHADIVANDSVLDVGCGTGSGLKALAKRHNGRLVGVDASARMIEHAIAANATNGQAEHIEFLAATAENLPFPDASFDQVLAINSIHHWQDVPKGLGEVHRVLRVGGTFVIGGELFDDSMVTGGQDYQKVCADAGLSQNTAFRTGDIFFFSASKDAA